MKIVLEIVCIHFLLITQVFGSNVKNSTILFTREAILNPQVNESFEKIKGDRSLIKGLQWTCYARNQYVYMYHDKECFNKKRLLTFMEAFYIVDEVKKDLLYQVVKKSAYAPIQKKFGQTYGFSDVPDSLYGYIKAEDLLFTPRSLKNTYNEPLRYIAYTNDFDSFSTMYYNDFLLSRKIGAEKFHGFLYCFDYKITKGDTTLLVGGNSEIRSKYDARKNLLGWISISKLKRFSSVKYKIYQITKEPYKNGKAISPVYSFKQQASSWAKDGLQVPLNSWFKRYSSLKGKNANILIAINRNQNPEQLDNGNKIYKIKVFNTMSKRWYLSNKFLAVEKDLDIDDLFEECLLLGVKELVSLEQEINSILDPSNSTKEARKMVQKYIPNFLANVSIESIRDYEKKEVYEMIATAIGEEKTGEYWKGLKIKHIRKKRKLTLNDFELFKENLSFTKLELNNVKENSKKYRIECGLNNQWIIPLSTFEF